MPTQQLSPQQRQHVNETVRPAIEQLVAIHDWLDGLVTELSNQQEPIANTSDLLGDGPDGTAPRTDAPTLTGQNVAQLLTFATGMRDQITNVALSALVKLSVRDYNTIKRML